MDKREAQILSDKVIDELVKIREAKGISPYRVWKDTGLAQSTVSDIESHEIHPTLYVTMIIADYLGVDLGEIISKVMKN